MLFGVLKKLSLPENLSGLDGFEVRIDSLEKIDLDEISSFRESCKYPLLFTLRRSDQGGLFRGPERERERLIEKLFSIEPTFFDLEYDVRPEFASMLMGRHPAVKVIASYHDFEKTPEDLDSILSQMNRFPCYARKIAVFAKSALDALRMLIFARAQEQFIGIAMGPEGLATRILGPVIGNLFDYATLGDPSAPGQLNPDELRGIYRYNSLNPSTQLFALIGDPVEESLGHQVHNHVMENAGIDGVYFKMRVKKEELAPFFRLVRQLPFRGMSVTMPLKESVLSFLDEERSGMGAVNTLLFEEGRIIGFNTDGNGALDAIEMKRSVKGKRVVVIGAGGAAKAIIHVALERGADILVLNRTAEKAIQLYGEKGGGLEKMESTAERGYDILINTTPDPLPIDPRWILSEALVMDIKSRPRVPPLLAQALEKGCEVVYGIEMFIHQAAAQEKLWSHSKIDEALVVQQLYSHLMS